MEKAHEAFSALVRVVVVQVMVVRNGPRTATGCRAEAAEPPVFRGFYSRLHRRCTTASTFSTVNYGRDMIFTSTYH
jgi:hypothetical protein